MHKQVEAFRRISLAHVLQYHDAYIVLVPAGKKRGAILVTTQHACNLFAQSGWETQVKKVQTSGCISQAHQQRWHPA